MPSMTRRHGKPGARHGVAVVLAFATLLAPAAAQGAAIAVRPLKPCYGAGERLALAGIGFTPNGGVTLTRDGQAVASGPVAANGIFTGGITLGSIRQASRIVTYTATDAVNPAITASVGLRRSKTSVRVRLGGPNPTRSRRITARGFTLGGRTLYAHVVRAGKRRGRTVRVGRLKNACGTVSARRRIFRRFRVGVYRVQFDTFRRYSPGRRQQAASRVRLFRTFRRVRISGVGSPKLGIGASIGQRWTPVGRTRAEEIAGLSGPAAERGSVGRGR